MPARWLPYGDDFYAGLPAITEHRLGRGRAIYVATRPEPALVAGLVGALLDDLGISAPLQAPQGVEVTRREGDGRSYLFVLNHNAHPVQVPLPMSMYDLLTRETRTAVLDLPAKGVAVLVPA